MDVELLGKVNKVIQSCTTQKQLKTAEKYCELFLQSLELDCYLISGIHEYFDIQRMLTRDLNKKRREL